MTPQGQAALNNIRQMVANRPDKVPAATQASWEIQAVRDADPQIKAQFDQWKATGQPPAGVQQLIQSYGISIPKGSQLGEGGTRSAGLPWYKDPLWIALIGGATAGIGSAISGAGAGASAVYGPSLEQLGASPAEIAGLTGAGVGAGTATGAGAATYGPSLEQLGASPSEIAGLTGAGGSSIPGYIKKLAQAAPLGAGLIAHAASGGGDDTAGAIPPELQQLLATAMRRVNDQEPLFQAINKQALAGLPTYAKGGS